MAVKTRYSYSPFGETEVAGEASDNPFQYTGRENDGPTGLQLNRMRYYSYRLKRFISEDPIGFAGGVNFYSYTGNSPINYTDPLGLYRWEGKGEYISGGAYGAGSGKLYVTLKTYSGIYGYEAKYEVILVGVTVGLPVGATAFSFEMRDFYYGDEPDALRMEGHCGIVTASAAFRSIGYGIGILKMGDGWANITGKAQGFDFSFDVFPASIDSELKSFRKINTLTGESYNLLK